MNDIPTNNLPDVFFSNHSNGLLCATKLANKGHAVLVVVQSTCATTVSKNIDHPALLVIAGDMGDETHMLQTLSHASSGAGAILFVFADREEKDRHVANWDEVMNEVLRGNMFASGLICDVEDVPEFGLAAA